MTDLRIRQNREFFNVPPQIALDIFRDIATTIDDALVVEYRDNKPSRPTTPLPATASPSISEDCENNDFISDDIETDRQPRKMTRARFRFSMIGVKIGEYVTFIPTNTPVKVASDNTVEHEGRIYKLSPFVGTFMPEEIRNTSGAYQGPKYFSYNGRTLEDIRKELEQNSEH